MPTFDFLLKTRATYGDPFANTYSSVTRKIYPEHVWGKAHQHRITGKLLPKEFTSLKQW